MFQFIFLYFGSQLFRHEREMPFSISIQLFFRSFPVFSPFTLLCVSHAFFSELKCSDLILLRGFSACVCSVYSFFALFALYTYRFVCMHVVCGMRNAQQCTTIISFINRGLAKEAMKKEWKREREGKGGN